MKLPKNLKDELDNFCYLGAAIIILAVMGLVSYLKINQAIVDGGFMLIAACLLKVKTGGPNNDTKEN